MLLAPGPPPWPLCHLASLLSLSLACLLASPCHCTSSGALLDSAWSWPLCNTCSLCPVHAWTLRHACCTLSVRVLCANSFACFRLPHLRDGLSSSMCRCSGIPVCLILSSSVPNSHLWFKPAHCAATRPWCLPLSCILFAIMGKQAKRAHRGPIKPLQSTRKAKPAADSHADAMASDALDTLVDLPDDQLAPHLEDKLASILRHVRFFPGIYKRQWLEWAQVKVSKFLRAKMPPK